MTNHIELGSETLYADARKQRFPEEDMELPYNPPTMDKQVLTDFGLDPEPQGFEADDWADWGIDENGPAPQPGFEVAGRISDSAIAPDSQPTPAEKQGPPPRRLPNVRWRDILTTLLELVGLLVLSYGFYMIAAWAGFICLGACLILMGVTLSLPPRSKDTGTP